MFGGQLKIAVEDRVGVLSQAVPIEIHQQEGQVVKHIDTSKAIVEFDRIEKHRHSVLDENVVEMEIAMAAANPPRAPPLFQQGGHARQRARCRAFIVLHALL